MLAEVLMTQLPSKRIKNLIGRKIGEKGYVS